MALQKGDSFTGEVKWFDDNKGYGFIIVDGEAEPREEIFVHYSGILGAGQVRVTLLEGERVEGIVDSNPRGLCAVGVMRA